jgi:hypothetical protein
MDVDANMGVKLTLRAGTGGLFTFEFTDVPGEGGGVVTFTHDTNMGGINPNDMEDFCNYDKTKDALGEISGIKDHFQDLGYRHGGEDDWRGFPGSATRAREKLHDYRKNWNGDFSKGKQTEYKHRIKNDKSSKYDTSKLCLAHIVFRDSGALSRDLCANEQFLDPNSVLGSGQFVSGWGPWTYTDPEKSSWKEGMGLFNQNVRLSETFIQRLRGTNSKITNIELKSTITRDMVVSGDISDRETEKSSVFSCLGLAEHKSLPLVNYKIQYNKEEGEAGEAGAAGDKCEVTFDFTKQIQEEQHKVIFRHEYAPKPFVNQDDAEDNSLWYYLQGNKQKNKCINDLWEAYKGGGDMNALKKVRKLYDIKSLGDMQQVYQILAVVAYLALNIYLIKIAEQAGAAAPQTPEWLKNLWDDGQEFGNDEVLKKYCLKIALSQVAITTCDWPLFKLCTMLNIQCYCTTPIVEEIERPSGMLNLWEYLPGDKGSEQYMSIYQNKLYRKISNYKERLVYDKHLLEKLTELRSVRNVTYKIAVIKRATRRGGPDFIEGAFALNSKNKLDVYVQPVFYMYLIAIDDLIKRIDNMVKDQENWEMLTMVQMKDIFTSNGSDQAIQLIEELIEENLTKLGLNIDRMNLNIGDFQEFVTRNQIVGAAGPAAASGVAAVQDAVLDAAGPAAASGVAVLLGAALRAGLAANEAGALKPEAVPGPAVGPGPAEGPAASAAGTLSIPFHKYKLYDILKEEEDYVDVSQGRMTRYYVVQPGYMTQLINKYLPPQKRFIIAQLGDAVEQFYTKYFAAARDRFLRVNAASSAEAEENKEQKERDKQIEVIRKEIEKTEKTIGALQTKIENLKKKDSMTKKQNDKLVKYEGDLTIHIENIDKLKRKHNITGGAAAAGDSRGSDGQLDYEADIESIVYILRNVNMISGYVDIMLEPPAAMGPPYTGPSQVEYNALVYIYKLLIISFKNDYIATLLKENRLDELHEDLINTEIINAEIIDTIILKNLMSTDDDLPNHFRIYFRMVYNDYTNIMNTFNEKLTSPIHPEAPIHPKEDRYWLDNAQILYQCINFKDNEEVWRRREAEEEPAAEPSAEDTMLIDAGGDQYDETPYIEREPYILLNGNMVFRHRVPPLTDTEMVEAVEAAREAAVEAAREAEVEAAREAAAGVRGAAAEAMSGSDDELNQSQDLLPAPGALPPLAAASGTGVFHVRAPLPPLPAAEAVRGTAAAAVTVRGAAAAEEAAADGLQEAETDDDDDDDVVRTTSALKRDAEAAELESNARLSPPAAAAAVVAAGQRTPLQGSPESQESPGSQPVSQVREPGDRDRESTPKRKEDTGGGGGKSKKKSKKKSIKKRKSIKKLSKRKSIKKLSKRKSIKKLSKRKSIKKLSKRKSIKKLSKRKSIKKLSKRKSKRKLK